MTAALRTRDSVGNVINSPIKRATLKSRNVKASVEDSKVRVPTNYIKTLREGENLTLEAAAKEIGITKHALIRVEQGTYDKILPKVLDHYVDKYAVSELQLVETYEDYQSSMRNRNYMYFGGDLDVNVYDFTHPFRQLRSRTNRGYGATPTEVAKELCIPQATITYFENNWRRQLSVPKAVANVLIEIGYKNAEVKQFCTAYKEWRIGMKSKGVSNG